VTADIHYDTNVDLVGSISACKATASGLVCRVP
jgi:hypothetical protein